MREVSGRVTALVVDGIERRGLDLAVCLDGLGVPHARLVDPHQRIDWETFADLVERAEALCGGPSQLEELFEPRGDARDGHAFVSVGRVFFQPRDIYRLMARWGLSRDVTNSWAVFDELDERRARMNVYLDEDQRGSLAFFGLLKGILRKLPALVGLPPCEVASKATPHQATYEIVLPEPVTLRGRARRALQAIAGTSATLSELEAEAVELRERNAELEAELAAQRRLDAAHRARLELVQLGANAGQVGIWSWDVAADALTWGAGPVAAGKLLDAVKQATLALYLARVHPDDRAEVEHQVRTAVANGHELVTDHRLVKEDGTIFWVRARGEITRAANGEATAITGTIVDVSEQKWLERQLLFANRMIAVGKLAAGVAHELNNPLGYVITNLALLRKHIDRGVPTEGAAADALRDALDAATEGAERMRDVTGDLRKFARPEEDRRTVVVLPAIIAASTRLVGHELTHRATLIAEHADDVPKVIANESRLGQVFTNLLVNAAHAIPERPTRPGVIRVRTYRDADGSAVASVEDNGDGIAPPVLKRIFEPFFTTKEVGEGTGLGLAICKGIVASLGGRIEVESELGRGSTFRVVLPPSNQREVTPEPLALSRPGGGRILVIDDEPRFGASLKMLLETYGFKVSVAETARAGRALAVEAPSFDVILCDLMMPGETGMDLYGDLASTRPDLAERMVFLTGGAFTPRASRFLDGIGNPHLDKPVELERLLLAIERTKSKCSRG